MDDLIAFLAARLDEDEAAAQPQAEWLHEYGKRNGDWTRFMFDPVIGPFGGQSPLRSIDRGLYVGRMSDPARVLREVAAKRAILAEHQPEPWGEPHPELSRCSQGHGDEGYWTVWPCAEARAITAVWSDHPGYRQEWKTVIELSTACRTDRHQLCGGYRCPCHCHSGYKTTAEEDAYMAEHHPTALLTVGAPALEEFDPLDQDCLNCGARAGEDCRGFGICAVRVGTDG